MDMSVHTNVHLCMCMCVSECICQKACVSVHLCTHVAECAGVCEPIGLCIAATVHGFPLMWMHVDVLKSS